VQCFLGNPADNERSAKWAFATYAAVPAYGRFLAELGFGDMIAPVAKAWREGRHDDALALVPQNLLEDTFAFGDAEEIAHALRGYEAHGVVSVVEPIAPPARLASAIAALAPGR
jgi:hypothetical protein